MYQQKSPARDSEADQTQSLPPLNSLVDDPTPSPISVPSIPN